MSSATDHVLVERVQSSHDPDAARELATRHSGIYVQMVKNFTPSGSYRQLDALDEKDSRIYEAALDFDPSRGTKFSTYLANTVRWRCLHQASRAKKFPHVSLQTPMADSCDDFLDDSMNAEVIRLVFEQAARHPDPRVKKIVDMRYKNSHNKTQRSWKAIAAELKMSVQGVINIHKKFINNTTKQLHV